MTNKLTNSERDALRKILKEKETEKRQKESISWRKVMQLSSFFAIAFNLLVLSDLFIFPQIVQHDIISKTEDLKIRRDHYNRRIIYTQEGKFWMVEHSKSDFTGQQLTYLKTPLFSIAYNIFNHQTARMITRYFPVRMIASVASMVVIIFATLGIWLTRLKKNKIADHLIQFMIMLTLAELIFFLI